MTQSSSNKKVANSLVALSSAAVLAVYAAGYVRTKAAAERFAEQSSDRRAPAPSARILTASLNTAPAPVLPAPGPETPSTPQPTAAETSSPPAPTPVPAAPAAPAPVVAAAPAPVVAAAPAPVAAATPAPLAIAASPAAPPLTPPRPWKDGTWKGWGTCRHGDIQAAVVVENGKITSATIADCQTRYSCDVIDKLPPEVVQRQTADVDRVGGATQSADAFYFAVYEALRQAHEAAPKASLTAAQPQAN